MEELHNEDAVPQHIVELFITIAKAVEDHSNGDAMTAIGMLLNHLTDGDEDLIERAVEHIKWVAVNTYSEPVQ